MANTHPKPPSLATLTARYVTNSCRVENSDTVFEPYEQVSAFVVEPQTAWTEATHALTAFGVSEKLTPPSEWSTIVRRRPTGVWVPLCVGEFPQRVSAVTAISSKDLRPVAESPLKDLDVEKLASQVAGKGTLGGLLVAAAMCRITGSPTLQRLLTLCEQKFGSDHPAILNERAAVAWQLGDRTGATTIWTQLPTNPVVAFNLGMAALASDQAALARKHLSNATKLPETSGWHHLAQLYSVLASS